MSIIEANFPKDHSNRYLYPNDPFFKLLSASFTDEVRLESLCATVEEEVKAVEVKTVEEETKTTEEQGNTANDVDEAISNDNESLSSADEDEDDDQHASPSQPPEAGRQRRIRVLNSFLKDYVVNLPKSSPVQLKSSKKN